MLGTRHGAPQPLLGIGHKADDQLAGHVAPHQTLGVGEVPLASFRRPIGVGLRQLQLAVSFQLMPDRLPVLRCRFHHRFAHLLLDQPLPQVAQLAGSCAELALLERELTFPCGIDDDHGQHALVYVDSCYKIRCVHWSILSVWRVTVERVRVFITHGLVLPDSAGCT